MRKTDVTNERSTARKTAYIPRHFPEEKQLTSFLRLQSPSPEALRHDLGDGDAAVGVGSSG